MLYTLTDLRTLFSYRDLANGRRYQKAGRVRHLAVTENGTRITARVLGSRPEPYAVQIRLAARRQGDAQLEAACSCPVGGACKHIAAALLQALEEAKHQPVAPPPPAQSAQTLPAPVAQWLNRLSNAVQRADKDYPDTVRDRILYLLQPDNRYPPATASVQVVAVRLLKDDSYGKERAYNAFHAAYGQRPQYVTPKDTVIFSELSRQMGNGQRLLGAEGAVLLERMLATGRCHWQSKDTPPLALGETRPARLCWRTDGRGLTRLGLDTEPPATQVLPVNPPWYVDAEQRSAGPAQLAIPIPLALELAASPALQPEDLPRVDAWLRQQLPAAQVPPAPAVPVSVVADINPLPILKLYSRQIQQYFYQTLPVDGAQLRFEYDGEQVSADDNVEHFSHYREGQVVRIQRQGKIEAVRLKRLAGLGLQRLSALYNAPALLSAGIARDFGLPTEDAWVQFMCEGVPRLRDEGWIVELDPGFRFDVVLPDEWYAELNESSGIDWFGLTLGVEIDGRPVNLLPTLVQFLRSQPAGAIREWLNVVADEERIMLTLPDGRLLPVPAQRVRSIVNVLMELYDEPQLAAGGDLRLPKIQAIRLAELETALYGEPLRWRGGEALRGLAQRLRGARIAEPPEPPAGLQATLRPYQSHGLAWLQFLREYELGGILADDMGLGKTVQALAFLQAEKNAGRMDRPCLIVAPTSLMANWRREAARFTPALKVLTLQGPERRRRFADIPGHDLVLTTYALLPRDSEDLLKQEYHVLILDESQAVKNPKAQAGVVARSLKVRQRLCLTGTPMENHLGELWSMFDFLMPGLLGDERQFRRLFRRPIEQFGDGERRERLVRRIAPFMLRRTKQQVAKELPAKTEIVRTVELHDAQRDLYESIRIAMQDKVRQAVRQKGLARSHIVILDALLRLRQVCCDPRLLKLEAARKFKIKRSAKLELLLELLGALVEEGRRILLFSQFTTMLGLIEQELARLGIGYVKLTGQTLDRAAPVERFQAEQVPLFLISLKAGGTGLNLTAADTVIHYDPWWNPAVEDQATDRAHRIGQDKPVFVYKLYTEGTVEERIRELQTRKRALLEGVLAADTEGKAPWTDQDLEYLFAPLE